jgi:methyltransferase
MMDSRTAYTILVGLVAAERVAELGLAHRHDVALRAAGGVEVGSAAYPWMVALHTAFPIACLAEVWCLRRPWIPPLGAVMLLAIACAMGLRAWTVAALGPRWTTRVLVVPGSLRVTTGPYRLLRHPNYLAVAVEVAALPLVHAAWTTAIVFSVLNGMLLRARIRAENAALQKWCGVPGHVSERA